MLGKQNQPHAKKAICGAKTRSGKPCQNGPMANGRCRLHGGKSTGPKNQKKNKNAEKHGLFSKYLPEETLEIIESVEIKPPIELLWDNIVIQYAAIIRAQKLMHVKDQEDYQKFITMKAQGNTDSVAYEIHTPWDRHERFMNAQSRAMTSLSVMIEKYEKLAQSDLATEEQKLRIEKLKLEITNVQQEEGERTVIVTSEEEMKRWMDEHSKHS